MIKLISSHASSWIGSHSANGAWGENGTVNDTFAGVGAADAAEEVAALEDEDFDEAIEDTEEEL